MKQFFSLFLFTILFIFNIQAQSGNIYSDSIKNEILQLNQKVEQIQLNLAKSYKKSKWGIFTATLGYTITIAGGQMLGGKNNNLGEVLLYTGGGVGIAGTAILIDSFNDIGKASGRRKRNKK